jgi:hypothetical protein
MHVRDARVYIPFGSSYPSICKNQDKWVNVTYAADALLELFKLEGKQYLIRLIHKTLLKWTCL